MMKLKTMLLVAGAAIGGMAGAANAMPLADVSTHAAAPLQNVRVVCNERGRCYQTRRRVYRRDAERNYYPGYRAYAYDYYDAPPSYYFDEGPGIGLSFGFGPGWR